MYRVGLLIINKACYDIKIRKIHKLKLVSYNLLGRKTLLSLMPCYCACKLGVRHLDTKLRLLGGANRSKVSTS